MEDGGEAADVWRLEGVGRRQMDGEEEGRVAVQPVARSDEYVQVVVDGRGGGGGGEVEEEETGKGRVTRTSDSADQRATVNSVRSF